MGTGLAKLLRQKFGNNRVILSDIIRPEKAELDNGKIYLKFKKLLNCKNVNP